MTSPYTGKDPSEWSTITKGLVAKHPLIAAEIVETVNTAWNLILKDSVIGGMIRIGVDIFPTPQVMGNFLHELVPLLLEKRYPGKWRRDQAANEKDLVYIPDDSFSVEIKTSSHVKGIFGNRSFSQASEARPRRSQSRATT